MEDSSLIAYDSSRSAAPGMTLASLQGLPLRLIALKLSNPGPLSQSCSAAYNAIHRDEAQMDFELEWFLRWVHVLAPLRPWQFAAVGWQRLGGQYATAEQLSSFILRLCAAKRQQQLLLHTGSSGMRPRNKQGQPTWAQQQFPEHTIQEVELLLQQLYVQNPSMAPAQQPESTDSAAAGKPAQPCRPRFTPMPQCLPQLSIQQQAHKLLDQGHAVRALRLLCDGPPWLLYQYAAAAGNLQLLQLLITDRNWTGVPHPYNGPDFSTTHVWTSAGGLRFLNTAQLCAFAAMRKGHVHVLTAMLWRAGSSIKGPPAPHQMGQLLRSAVRHSNAACLETLLDFTSCDDYGRRWLVIWPQHLVMAASRADPWAGEVIGLLLRVIEPKLLAAKYMRPVHLAACRTGHAPVLQQLVQQAVQHSAAGSTGHMCQLLSAAAEAGNLWVWRALLGLDLLDQQLDGAHSSGSNSSGSNSSSSICSSSSGRIGPTDGNRSTVGVSGSDNCAIQTTGCLAAGQLPAKDGCLLSRLQHQVQQQGGLTSPTTAAALGSVPCQPQPQQLSDTAHTPQALALPADLIASALQDPADMLLQLLQHMGSNPLQGSVDDKLRLRADADRAAMADAFMQYLAQVPPGQVLWADSLQSHDSGLDCIRAEMRARFCLDAWPWAPDSPGRLQQLLARPTLSAAQLVWLLQQELLPVPPTGWQPAPTASDNLQSCICYCLKSGQRKAANTLWRFAQQLQLQLAEEQLAQAAFEGALHAAAAAQDSAGLQHLLDFAVHHKAVGRSAFMAVTLHKDTPLTADGQLAEAVKLAEPVASLLQQAVEAAAYAGQQADSKVQCAARLVSAHAAAAGLDGPRARYIACPPRSWQEESSSIIPLWQHAALAVTAQRSVCDMFTFRMDRADAVLASVLEPVVLGHRLTDAWPADDTAAAVPATAATASAAAAATPAFLKGAAVGTSSWLASPSPPPEHQSLAAALSAVGMSTTWSMLWGPSGWTRPDAVAWILHSDQQHLFANSAARPLATSMVARFIDLAGFPPLQPTPAAALQEQQLRWHRGLQSQKLSVTEGFGALPCHAAGTADLATLLLGLGYPVDASNLVKRLSGATGPAAVECVKAMVAAVLAVPLEQLRGKGVKFAIPVMPHDRKEAYKSGRWLCVSPAALRKAVDVGDMDLITLLILLNQRFVGSFGEVA